jgi:NOL1/NOP2/fmu family ribosome biogenesis protein
MNNNALQFINTTKNTLYFKQVGTSIGELKHGSLIPHHFLALSNYINPGVEAIELSKDEAVKYLKKESFQYDGSSAGLKLITYKGFGIGWAKILNNRANNYLPSNYTIFNKDIGLSK